MTVQMIIELPQKRSVQTILQAIDTYKLRLQNSIERSQRRLDHFEQQYNVDTSYFLEKMVAEDLVGGIWSM